MALNMHPESLVVRKEDGHLTNPVGEETVLLDLKTGDYLGLDPVASSIWEHLRTPQSLASIVERLLAEFDVEEEECRRDTIEFLERIEALGLLQPVP